MRYDGNATLHLRFHDPEQGRYHEILVAVYQGTSLVQQPAFLRPVQFELVNIDLEELGGVAQWEYERRVAEAARETLKVHSQLVQAQRALAALDRTVYQLTDRLTRFEDEALAQVSPDRLMRELLRRMDARDVIAALYDLANSQEGS